MIVNASPKRPESFHVTSGMLAFTALMFLPAVLAFAVLISAWVVSDEVYAAERAAAAGSPTEIATWKTTVVGICPIH